MDDVYIFEPIRRGGEWFHAVAILVLIVGAVGWAWRSIQVNISEQFLVTLIPLVIFLVLILYLVYKLYSLENARYSIDRNQIILQWGFRIESIPMSDIQWVLLEEDLKTKIPKPLRRWPGAVLGRRRMRDGTPVEFIASTSKSMVLIGTEEQIFAISPQSVNKLLSAYQTLTELGPLIQPEAQSLYSTSLISQIWRDDWARILIFAAILVTIVLSAWVLITIPNREEVSLGFTSSLVPRSPIDSIRLLLLPFINAMILLTNTLVGVILYRREDYHNFAYLLWGGSVFVGVLFLVALGQLLQNS